MTGKHDQWHKGWRHNGDRLLHISGMAFVVSRGDGYTDINADKSTLEEFQRYEIARGVVFADLLKRLKRLNWEALEWHKKNL